MTSSNIIESSLCNNIMYPTDTDIICGRGRGLINHPGNQKFIEILRNNIPRYEQAPKRVDKSILVASIVENLQLEHGMRFLKKIVIKDEEKRQHGENSNNKDVCYCYYVELKRDQAREKTGHAIRDLIKNDQRQQERKNTSKSTKRIKQKERKNNNTMIKENTECIITTEYKSTRAEYCTINQQPMDSVVSATNEKKENIPENLSCDPSSSLLKLLQQPVHNFRISHTGAIPPLPAGIFQNGDSIDNDKFEEEEEEKLIQQEDADEQQRNNCRRHRRWSSAVLDLFNYNDLNIDDSPLSLSTVLDDADILERDILLDSCLFTAGDSQYIFENN